jgi:Zn-dependent protease with chaperone function
MTRARRRWLLVTLVSAVLAAIAPTSAFAQAADSVPHLAAADSAHAYDSATGAVSASAPTRDYLAEVRANFTPENRAYAARRTMLGFLEPLWAIAVGLVILFSGFSARMRDIAHGFGHRRYVRILVFFTLYTILGFVLTFPIAWYGGFALEHQFGLSNQSLSTWLADELKGQAISIVFLGVIPLLLLVYRAIEKSPRRWWLWLALGTLPVIVFSELIQPVVVDPIFNKFTPLQDQHLKGEILALAAKADIPARNVYQVDKSAQTKKINAYVNGFGASQRIVIWDTTLKAMKEDEILFVMGHEIGHYKLGHVWKGIVLISLLSVALFYASYRIMRWSVRRFGSRWGFTDLHDVASLPLLAVTLTIVSFIAQPLINLRTRTTEHEADLYALELTHSNDAGARAFIKLGAQNKSNPEPGPLLKVFQYTHPPLIERIKTAQEYRPWEQGKPNKYFKPKR